MLLRLLSIWWLLPWAFGPLPASVVSCSRICLALWQDQQKAMMEPLKGNCGAPVGGLAKASLLTSALLNVWKCLVHLYLHLASSTSPRDALTNSWGRSTAQPCSCKPMGKKSLSRWVTTSPHCFHVGLFSYWLVESSEDDWPAPPATATMTLFVRSEVPLMATWSHEPSQRKGTIEEEDGDKAGMKR